MQIIRHLLLNKSVRFVFLALPLISINAHAAATDFRTKQWSIFLGPQYTNSKVLQFDGGAEADINDRTSISFGFAYNLNANIEFDVQFASSNANYTSTTIPDPSGTPEKSSGSLYTSSINFGATYNFLKSPLTPYVSANIGSTYIDSGIPTGNTTTGCYWYPYYGYICGPVSQTYTSSNFSYGASLGLRYDVNRNFYIKGDVGKNYVDINSSNTPDFTTYRFIFGFMFGS
jgi:hypothetical protein